VLFSTRRLVGAVKSPAVKRNASAVKKQGDPVGGPVQWAGESSAVNSTVNSPTVERPTVKRPDPVGSPVDCTGLKAIGPFLGRTDAQVDVEQAVRRHRRVVQLDRNLKQRYTLRLVKEIQ